MPRYPRRLSVPKTLIPGQYLKAALRTPATTSSASRRAPTNSPWRQRAFKKYVRSSVLVQTATDTRLDVNLEVGATTETITVTEADAAAENGKRRNEPHRRHPSGEPAPRDQYRCRERRPRSLQQIALLPGAQYSMAANRVWSRHRCERHARQQPDDSNRRSGLNRQHLENEPADQPGPAWMLFRKSRFRPATSLRSMARPLAAISTTQ